jgi:hypothetical protein
MAKADWKDFACNVTPADAGSRETNGHIDEQHQQTPPGPAGAAEASHAVAPMHGEAVTIRIEGDVG